MPANKIILNNEVKIDLSADTITRNDAKKGVIFHGRDGIQYEGTYEVSLQKKTVTPTEEQQAIVADDTYEGLSEVVVEAIPEGWLLPTGVVEIIENTGDDVINVASYAEAKINVQPKLQGDKEVPVITESGVVTVTPDEGYDGLSQVEVEVSIPIVEPNLQSKVVQTITANTSEPITVTADEGFDGLSSVELTVDVPIPEDYLKPEGELEVTENGEDIDIKQYASLTVNVPISEEVPEWDGSYTPSEDAVISEGLAINGIIREYKVNAGATVNAGDFVEFVNKSSWGRGTFNSSTTNYISSCKLDDFRVLVAYQDGSYGTAVVLNVENSGVTIGTEAVFNSAATYSISVVALTDSKVLVAYRDGGNSDYGTAIILNINAYEITIGTKVVFNSESISYVSAVALSDSKVLVASRKGTSSMVYSVVFTIDGDNIAVGGMSYGYGSSISTFSLVVLSDYKVVMVYDYQKAFDYYIEAIVLSISGTSITYASSRSLKKTGAGSISAVALSDSKVLAAWGNTEIGAATIFNIDGTSIIPSNVVTEFHSTESEYVSAVALSDSKVLVAYADYNVSSYGTAKILTINGNSITAGEVMVFNTAKTAYLSAIAFSETSALVLYRNVTAGTYTGLTIDGTTVTTNDVATAETFVQKATSNLYNVGVAKTAGAEGETVEVYCAV